MTRSQSLAKRLREVLLDGRWIANTNFKAQLETVTWQQANQQVGELNTIAILTFHINYYLDGILNVFNGGDLEIRDKFSFNAPAISSEEDWNQRMNALFTNAEKFASHVESMTDDQLEAPFVDEKYGSYERNIEGVIEHCYYHLGQVSLIRKMIAQD